MTVPSTQSRKTFAGDGVTTSFATTPVVFFDSSDLEVRDTVTATGVSTLLVENTSYTVSGGDTLSGAVGTVSLAGGSSPHGALASGHTLVITRVLPLTQETDFVQNDPSDASVAEATIDRLTMITQQLDSTLSRSFTLAEGDVSGASTVIATPTGTSLIGWDTAGTSLQNYSTSALSLALTTAFSLTLLDDTTAAQAAVTLAVIPNAIGTTKGDTIGFSASATPVRVGVGTDGQVKAADSSQTSGLVYVDNPARKVLNINPNWQIDQINEGALYTVNTTDVRGPDGLSGTAVGAGVFKLRTLADPDNAALKCVEITCTTADASIAATDDYFIYSAIEGYDTSSLFLGTASAVTLTVQFKFKTSVTGVYGVSLANSAKNRSNYKIITVADTSEHEYTLSFTLDTTGTWLYTNGVGLYLAICLSAGSNFQGTAGTWAGDAKQTTSAQCNFMSSTSNIAYLKRIQVIPGALVQAYAMPDIQKELAKCQRYYVKTFAQGTAPAQAVGITSPGSLPGYVPFGDTIIGDAKWQFPVTMRATPTVVTYNPGTTNTNWRNSSNSGDAGIGLANTGDTGTTLNGGGGSSQNSYRIHATASARLS